jgi:hypothetical protein
MWIKDWFSYLSKMKLCSQYVESLSHYFKLYYAAQKGQVIQTSKLTLMNGSDLSCNICF